MQKIAPLLILQRISYEAHPVAQQGRRWAAAGGTISWAASC